MKKLEPIFGRAVPRGLDEHELVEPVDIYQDGLYPMRDGRPKLEKLQALAQAQDSVLLRLRSDLS